MPKKTHKSCYGKLFPALPSLRADGPTQGEAFSVLPRKTHGTVATERRVQVDIEQWNDCLACEQYEHCRELCQAKLSLESSVLAVKLIRGGPPDWARPNPY